MTGGHIDGGKAVGETRGNLIYTVTACRIPHQVDPVRVDVFVNGQICKKPFVKRIAFVVEMRVPGISDPAGRNVDAAFHAVAVVDLHMIPLTVVELFCGTAAAVKCDIDRVAVFSRFSDDGDGVLHFGFAVDHGFVFGFLQACRICLFGFDHLSEEGFSCVFHRSVGIKL